MWWITKRQLQREIDELNHDFAKAVEGILHLLELEREEMLRLRHEVRELKKWLHRHHPKPAVRIGLRLISTNNKNAQPMPSKAPLLIGLGADNALVYAVVGFADDTSDAPVTEAQVVSTDRSLVISVNSDGNFVFTGATDGNAAVSIQAKSASGALLTDSEDFIVGDGTPPPPPPPKEATSIGLKLLSGTPPSAQTKTE